MSDDEDQIEFAMRFLLTNRQEPRRVVSALAREWPQMRALQLIYVLSITAGTIDHMLAGAEHNRIAQELWRMAGLVGVDMYMMGLMGLPCDHAADLMAYWQVHDRFFLN